MHRSSLAATLALIAPPVVAVSGAMAADGGRPITVELTGAAEVPGPGDPEGTGVAHFRLNPGQGRICYSLEVSEISPAVQAHIHIGSPDVAGPVVVRLLAPTDGSSSSCADVERELVLDIIRDPGNYYVNVHNAEYPGGAVRGQLG